MVEFILVKEKDFQKARNVINSIPKEKKIIFSSTNDELNRKILEKEDINVLLINQKNRKDFLKQRNSGFNHILAKIAEKKRVRIGINFDEIIENHGKEKAKILARIIQNIKLCKKRKLNMCFVSERGYVKNNRNNEKNIYDIKSLGLVLGMPTWMTKKLEFIDVS